MSRHELFYQLELRTVMMAVKAVKAVKAVTSIFSPEYFKLYTQILFLTIFLYMLYYFVRLVVHIAYANKCTNCQYIKIGRASCRERVSSPV